MAAGRDLLTILYQPRETMRRVLSEPDRWTARLVIAAAIFTSIGDPDFQNLKRALPGLNLATLIALAIGSMILVSVAWLALVWVAGWAVMFVGKLLDGTGNVTDVRAALAWSLVPLMWSVIYRLPEAFYKHQVMAKSAMNERELLMNMLANGGCSIFLAMLVVRFLVCVLCVWLASSTVAEAQRFSTLKGLATVAIVGVAPIVIVIAAVIAVRAH